MEDKASKRALEAYPKDIEEYIDVKGVKSVVDNNSWQRTIFLEGYRQAEKDNELTWEDIATILDMENDILHECNSQSQLLIETYPVGKDYYQEILKRFKERKK